MKVMGLSNLNIIECVERVSHAGKCFIMVNTMRFCKAFTTFLGFSVPFINPGKCFDHELQSIVERNSPLSSIPLYSLKIPTKNLKKPSTVDKGKSQSI